MANHSSSHSANVSSRTVKILGVVLILSLALSLVLIRSSLAPSLPAIKLEPKYVTGKVGQLVPVQLRVHGATYPDSEVYAWQVRMTWNPAYLLVYPSPTYGDFMSAPRVGYWGILLYDASVAQPNVTVTIGSDYYVGQQVWIKDDVHSETNSIKQIWGNKLVMNNNLTNTYAVAANAGAYPIPELAPISTVDNTNGVALMSVSTQKVTPGAQGDGLLATLRIFIKQDVTALMNITDFNTFIKTTLGDVVGDTAGELDKQNAYKAMAEDINGDGIISGSDLFSLGKDFNKCPIQLRSPTANSAPSTPWTNPTGAYVPDYFGAAYTNVNLRQQIYKTFGFPTTVWTSVTKVEIAVLARIGALYSGGPPADDDVQVEVSNDGGTTFSGTTWTLSPTITANYTYFVIDATTAYAWTPTYVASIAVRFTYLQVGVNASNLYVDWLAARVTPSPLTISSSYSDVNNNGIVTGTDLTQLAGQFGKTYGT